MVIVAGLSAYNEIEHRMLDNNAEDLDRTDIERVVWNEYNILFQQQHDSKALSACKGTATADRDKRKNRRPRTNFEGNCFNCGKNVTALANAGAQGIGENPEISPLRGRR